jgi:hypothetical protein
VPAAAVIPAPIAYIKVVAVKKLVVEFLIWPRVRPRGQYPWLDLSFWRAIMPFIWCFGDPGLLP